MSGEPPDHHEQDTGIGCPSKLLQEEKEELSDPALLTRGQDIRLDTLWRNGADSPLYGTMETLQHGKCLVKIPVLAIEVMPLPVSEA